MNAHTSIVLALLVTALAVASIGGTGNAPPPAAPASVAPAVQPPSPALQESVAQPTAAPTPTQQLVMPDGTSLPPLNGAIDPPKLRWQRGRPYSPVTGTVRLPDGRDAYLHKDGTRSITFMTFRKDLNRHVAVTAVSSPVTTTGTLAEELPSGR